jgi:hypothetical protein
MPNLSRESTQTQTANGHEWTRRTETTADERRFTQIGFGQGEASDAVKPHQSPRRLAVEKSEPSLHAGPWLGDGIGAATLGSAKYLFALQTA